LPDTLRPHESGRESNRMPRATCDLAAGHPMDDIGYAYDPETQRTRLRTGQPIAHTSQRVGF
jgi:hypothetical protein